jgi:hypothetical protein
MYRRPSLRSFALCASLPPCNQVLEFIFLGRDLPSLGSALSLITLVGGALGYVLSDAAFKVLGCSSTSDFYCTSTVLLI